MGTLTSYRRAIRVMGRLISKVVRWTWLVPAALVLACLPLLAATFANNNATVAAPAGVIDAVGGCNTNSPPDCIGNNASSATVNVWATTVAKSSTPANGSTVLAGHPRWCRADPDLHAAGWHFGWKLRGDVHRHSERRRYRHGREQCQRWSRLHHRGRVCDEPPRGCSWCEQSADQRER